VASDPSFDESLLELFRAERDVRESHDRLASLGRSGELEGLLAALRRASDAAGGLDPAEAALRQVCVARLLGEFDGAEVADALIDVLASDHAEARHEAGEQLQGLAYDRFKEVALAAERALERFPDGAPCLVELPYLLVEVPEPGVVKLLGKFLAHGDVETVAAAVEAVAEIGDPAALKFLEPLVNDERTTTVGDDGGEQAEVTLGELAGEAIELLSRPEEG
jgi:HEAT repeat protein